MIVTRDEQVRQAIRRATTSAKVRGTTLIVCEVVKRDGRAIKVYSEALVDSLCGHGGLALRQLHAVHRDGYAVRLSR